MKGLNLPAEGRGVEVISYINELQIFIHKQSNNIHDAENLNNLCFNIYIFEKSFPDTAGPQRGGKHQADL